MLTFVKFPQIARNAQQVGMFDWTANIDCLQALESLLHFIAFVGLQGRVSIDGGLCGVSGRQQNHLDVCVTGRTINKDMVMVMSNPDQRREPAHRQMLR